MYTQPWVKQVAGGKLIYNTGNPAWHSVMAQVGGGREAQKGGWIWLIRVVVWQKPTQHCKAIILQLKSFKKVHDTNGHLHWVGENPQLQ